MRNAIFQLWSRAYDMFWGRGGRADEFFSRRLLEAYRAFTGSAECWTPEARDAYHLGRLKAVVAHAYARIPFYRELLTDRGLKPTDIIVLGDIARFPVVGKEDLRAAPRTSWTAPTLAGRQRSEVTSGSRGVPFEFSLDRKADLLNMAHWERMWRWYGRERGRTKKIVLADPAFHRIQDRSLQLSVFELLEDPDGVCKRLVAEEGAALIGYASGLRELAAFLESRGARLKLPLALSFAENLFPAERPRLEKVLGGRVYDFYGVSELGIVGQECEMQDGFHINEESFLVEIVPSGHGSAAGTLLITSFFNGVMPLIRYCVGDVAEWDPHPCPCGRTLRTIRIAGRDTIVLKTPLRTIHEFEFNNALKRFVAEIEQFQVMPQGRGGVRLTIVSRAPSRALAQAIIRAIRAEIGAPLRVSVAWASRIERTPRGKSARFKRAEQARPARSRSAPA